MKRVWSMSLRSSIGVGDDGCGGLRRSPDRRLCHVVGSTSCATEGSPPSPLVSWRGWVTGFVSITVWGMSWRSPIGVGDDGEWRSGTTECLVDCGLCRDDGVETPTPVRLLPPKGPFQSPLNHLRRTGNFYSFVFRILTLQTLNLAVWSNTSGFQELPVSGDTGQSP